MNKIKSVIELLFPHCPFDAIAFGLIDFQKESFHFLEAHQKENGPLFVDKPHFYFDLASVTKPLTNSLSYFLNPKAFSEEMLLCLNHRAGLPAWGLLSKNNWSDQILSYKIKNSETLYSDFSALRVLLELKKIGIDEKKLCQAVWDKETLNWLDMDLSFPLLQYGFRDGLANMGQVHDPNAYVIYDFCSHAGLFSTVGGLCQTLLNYQKKTDFIHKVKSDLNTHKERFSFGWDRVENPNNTLAGAGCGKFTFGHLGFTGTSVWIDPDKSLGHVILTNATKDYWYQKNELNDLRRAIGEVVWQM